MTVLFAVARAISWQVWVMIGLLAAGGLWGIHQYRAGQQSVIEEVQRRQIEAGMKAQTEADRLRSGDRSRVQQFDREDCQKDCI